ncbi:hypothetical protein [Taibaiella koreensis]|uniref:hypothetical protein n=1 Tax=Taibaiella koreensis TaxID=1268548 RepID=UPI0013C34B29|nr:hypothetical protein [Taibaiella koreensis]
MAKLKEELKEFASKPLFILLRRPDIREKIKLGILSQTEKDVTRYAQYMSKLLPGSFNRAFKGPGITPQENLLLAEIVDFYIEEYCGLLPLDIDRAAPQPEKAACFFSEQTSLTLFKRAGSLCSAPGCLRLTAGPVLAAPDRAIELGRACAIRGLRKGDPRYDPAVAVVQDSVENGIWLCANDATLVEASPEDYPAALLQAWKDSHELLIKACLDGKKKITLMMNQGDRQGNIAIAMLSFFAQQEVLCSTHAAYEEEDMIAQVRHIGDFLMEHSLDFGFGSKLEQQMYAVDALCDAFLDRIPRVGISTAGFFSIFRKLLGMLLLETARHYQLSIPHTIVKIIPGSPDVNT